MKDKVKALELKLARAEEYITDVLTFKAGEKATSLASAINPYSSREKLVAELVMKYKGYAKAGNQLIQRIVDTRAAFTMASGLSARPMVGPTLLSARGRGDKSVPATAGAAELEFIRRLIRQNQLDGQFGQQLAVEKELEGQVLLTLDYRPGDDAVLIRFISWNDTHYQVCYADETYAEIKAITYETDDNVTVRVPTERAVFIKFNARIHSREGVPALSGLLPEAEDIDLALRDWRKINRFFASPTPYFKTADIQEARDLYDRLLAPGVDWRIGKVFCGPAEFSLVGMNDQGFESIQREIETKVKILAGGAGVPVQFLGFPEFMSNRATAENTMEPVALISVSEQRSWLGGFSELFNKAITLRNDLAPAGSDRLEPGRVAPVMRFVTREKIEQLRDLYLPLWQSGAIPLETLLKLLPESDADNADPIESEMKGPPSETPKGVGDE
ncbi:MAG TPA: hypothetical protein VM658_14560 [bacterium]|nr:hypothetical protein [bacterium]